MVANFRCNEVKEEALLMVQDNINNLKTTSFHPEDFIDHCKDILKIAVGHFDEIASQYDPKVYGKLKKDLAANLLG